MAQISKAKAFSRLEGRYTSILNGFQYAGMSLVVVMMVLTVIHSIGRYIFSAPIPGLIEISSFMLVTMIFLSIAYVHMLKGHIVIGIILDRLSERSQAIVDSITYFIGFAVGVLAIVYTFMEGISMSQMGDTSMILEIPIYPFYFVVCLGWALFTLATLMQLVKFISRAVEK